MIYDITHVTEFDYQERVSVSHHIARLTPRRSDRQTPLAHAWTFNPAASISASTPGPLPLMAK